jgi:integrase
MSLLLDGLRAVPSRDLLRPAKLSAAAAKAVRAFQRESRSANTERTYMTALRYWGAWHSLRFGVPIDAPIGAPVVIQFIVDHLEHQPNEESTGRRQHLLPLPIDRALVEQKYKAKCGPWSLATVETRLAALSQAHDAYIAANPQLQLGPEGNPMRDPRVRRGLAPARPQAATAQILQSLLATCDNDLVGIRDRALLYLGFSSGGRRRSEIVAASFANVRKDGDGFVFELHYSKTNRNGRRHPDNFKPIQGVAAEALRQWIAKLLDYRVSKGPLFRKVRGNRIYGPLQAGAVREIIRNRSRLSGQPLGSLSAHSLRSGFVTEAARQGISLGETMKLTGHRSVQTVMGYYQSGEVSVSRAARLLDAPKK